MKKRAQGLLDRLITRNNYYLALQIAKYLKLPEKEGCSHILVHWAKYKVKRFNLVCPNCKKRLRKFTLLIS